MGKVIHIGSGTILLLLIVIYILIYLSNPQLAKNIVDALRLLLDSIKP